MTTSFSKLATKLALVFSSAMLVIAGCSTKNEIDCEKEPKKAVNNSFSVGGNQVVIATTKADDIYNLEVQMTNDLLKAADPAKTKYGEIGAIADISTHMGAYQDIAAKDLRQAVKSGAVSNINTNSQNKMNGDALQVVVVDCAHVGSKFPVLKVRVVNKKCAGAEVWITAHTLNKYGHVINYSH